VKEESDSLPQPVAVTTSPSRSLAASLYDGKQDGRMNSKENFLIFYFVLKMNKFNVSFVDFIKHITMAKKRITSRIGSYRM
jgi:hypothetical protein